MESVLQRDTWTLTQVGGEKLVRDTSLIVDSSNDLHLTYRNSESGSLQYAFRADGWQIGRPLWWTQVAPLVRATRSRGWRRTRACTLAISIPQRAMVKLRDPSTRW